VCRVPVIYACRINSYRWRHHDTRMWRRRMRVREIVDRVQTAARSLYEEVTMIIAVQRRHKPAQGVKLVRLTPNLAPIFYETVGIFLKKRKWKERFLTKKEVFEVEKFCFYCSENSCSHLSNWQRKKHFQLVFTVKLAPPTLPNCVQNFKTRGLN